MGAKSGLPALRAYLAESNEARNMNLLGALRAGGWLLPLGLAAYLFFTRSFVVAIIGYFIASAVLQWLIERSEIAQRRRNRQKNPLRQQAAEAIATYTEFIERGTFEERLHPSVAAGLEACARTFFDIRRVLESREWKDRQSGEHWERVARSSREAADRAMQDAILASLYGYRRKGMKRKSWERAVEEDPAAGGAQATLAQIHQGMEELWTELVAAVDRRDRSTLSSSVDSSTAIDTALAHLREVQVAEAELNAEVRLRQS